MAVNNGNEIHISNRITTDCAAIKLVNRSQTGHHYQMGISSISRFPHTNIMVIKIDAYTIFVSCLFENNVVAKLHSELHLNYATALSLTIQTCMT